MKTGPLSEILDFEILSLLFLLIYIMQSQYHPCRNWSFFPGESDQPKRKVLKKLISDVAPKSNLALRDYTLVKLITDSPIYWLKASKQPIQWAILKNQLTLRTTTNLSKISDMEDRDQNKNLQKQTMQGEETLEEINHYCLLRDKRRLYPWNNSVL